jgi:glycosyltransferase involved in cell wall biosynthesis
MKPVSFDVEALPGRASPDRVHSTHREENIIEEIVNAFEKALIVNHDLRDPHCKALCDRLTALSWKVLRAKEAPDFISRRIFESAMNATKNFPHLSSRIYEVMNLIRIRRILEVEKGTISDVLDYYRHETNAPTRPNLMFQGILNYKLYGMKDALYYFLKGNQEYIGDSITTPFFAYSRSVCAFSQIEQVTKAQVENQLSNNNRTCFLVAANSAYVAKFLKNYVEKIAPYLSNESLHLNWILDPEDDSSDKKAQEAINAAKKMLHDQFRVTRESIKDFKDKRSYFAFGDGALFEETLAPLSGLSNIHLERRFLTQQEIASLHKSYGIFLCPTRMDTQGVSRDEAMASGLVPVTNAVAAIPEFVDEGCGVLAPGEDHLALAQGIENLILNPDKFQQMSAAAAARVRRQSDASVVISAELKLIGKDCTL